MLRSAISGNVVRNSHARVVNELGRAIVSGTMASGSVLPGDAELAQRFDVSRTVLREAMKTLAAKGMVVAKAKIGTRVTARTGWNLFDADVLGWYIDAGVEPAFLGHLAEMRLSFEPFAATLASARATPAQVAQLYRCIEAMEKADSREAFALADLDLHMAILGMSGNPFMNSVGSLIEAALVTSFRRSSPFGDPGLQKSTADAHRAIVDAIVAQDPEAAARAMRGVIEHGRDRITATGG